MSYSALRKEAEAILKATGLPWVIEEGSKHSKVRLDGKLITVVSHGWKAGRDCKHLRAKINQFMRLRK